MSVNVIIITHEEVGPALLKAVEQTFEGKLPLPTMCVPIKSSCDPESIVARLSTLIDKLNPKDGLLILTDLYGSTPSNIAMRLENKVNLKIISGVNMPMLIRVMNYADKGLNELATRAIDGGTKGVRDCCQQVG